MSPRTRRLAELAVEIVVPVLVVAVLGPGPLERRRCYYPPLSDVLDKFGETWVFERFGSDVVP